MRFQVIDHFLVIFIVFQELATKDQVEFIFANSFKGTHTKLDLFLDGFAVFICVFNHLGRIIYTNNVRLRKRVFNMVSYGTVTTRKVQNAFRFQLAGQVCHGTRSRTH